MPFDNKVILKMGFRCFNGDAVSMLAIKSVSQW